MSLIMVQPQKFALSLLLCSFFHLKGIKVVQCCGVTKLFVFGDSYADTGNNINPPDKSWRMPYGTTFPGSPAGRFSDRLIFTDFLASSLRLKSPTPYVRLNWRNSRSGVNFAYGGTGVFDTKKPYPNMTTQIDFFKNLVDRGHITHQDLAHSLVHVSLAGNDYSNYHAKNASSHSHSQNMEEFMPQVINQLALNLERIYAMGVRKISVTMLEPTGCLPVNTYTTSFKQCDSRSNAVSQFHNSLLQNAISKLNNYNSTTSPFILVDLYKAFNSAIHGTPDPPRNNYNVVFNEPLKPCCKGINSTVSCGSVDENGMKLYTICKDPGSSLFWDGVHLTQAGWRAITLSLMPTIKQQLQ